jgi:hypothetical protein
MAATPARRTDSHETATKRQMNNGLRKLCGCRRRVWAKCPHPWHFNFFWNNTPYRFSLGRKITAKTDAETEADRLRTAIRAGTFPAIAAQPPTPAPEQLTLTAFGEIFLLHCPKRRGKHRGEPRGEDDRTKLNRLQLCTARAGAWARCRFTRSSKPTSQRC